MTESERVRETPVPERRRSAARRPAAKEKLADKMPTEGKWDRSRDLLFWVKLQSVAMCILLALLTYFSISTSIKMHKLDRSIELVEQDLEQLRMDDVNEAIDSLTEAADNLAKLDMDSFNKTVDNLGKVTDGLARVSEALGKIGSIFGGGSKEE